MVTDSIFTDLAFNAALFIVFAAVSIAGLAALLLSSDIYHRLLSGLTRTSTKAAGRFDIGRRFAGLFLLIIGARGVVRAIVRLLSTWRH